MIDMHDFSLSLHFWFTHKPGGLWWSHDSREHLFGLPRRPYRPLVLAAVLRGRGLRQAEGEGGALAGRQDGELAGVDGRGRGLGKRHLGAPLLAFVFHHDSLRRGSLRFGAAVSARLVCRMSWNNKSRKILTDCGRRSGHTERKIPDSQKHFTNCIIAQNSK